MPCNLLEVSPIVPSRPSSLQWAIVGRYRSRSHFWSKMAIALRHNKV
ncbi:hypothetical protein [Microcoleus sp. OTE_8_concoct_300]